MRARGRDKLIPAAFAVLALVVALVQRPGWSSSDTKIDLHTDPLRFLGEIVALWTPSSGLGGVESAQYAGYLFPMGPFFALGHLTGLPDWLVDRLWLGLLLAVGCWGIVRLGEATGALRTPAGLTTAAAVYLLNPYVVVFANRTTVTLLAYALLPWLVFVTWRGLRAPTGWRMPAVLALLVSASGGGINAAVVAFVLLAPLVLVIFEPLTGAVAWGDARAFTWRGLAATAAASTWWAAPAAAQALYGVDFLRFTEPAGAIWATTSVSESFRAMGYWISYIGVGFNGLVRPYFSDSGTLLFNAAVLCATFVVPGAALAAFARTRSRRYAAFFLALVLLATLVMAVGFPDGTPLRHGTTFAYNHFSSVRFLRTTYKAGPLLVLGVAALAGMAVDSVRLRRGALSAVGVLAAGAAIVLSAWPLVSGRAVDHQVTWKRIPAAWKDAAHALDHSLGDDRRAVVLPGQLYAFYRWGGTVDPILPALTKKPVAVRNAVPYGDLRATDLLWTTDALVEQQRLLPGQLLPLVRLMSAGTIVSATDDDVFRSGALDPRAAAAQLAGQGLGRPRAFGPASPLPEVRTYGVARAAPLVRLEPRAPLTVVDGSAAGLADLAGLGALPPRPFAYAGDLTPGALAAAARTGGTIVVSDSNRRRVQVVSRMRQNSGATLAAGDPISEDAATLDPFADRGEDGQTVAVLHGARWIRAPFSPGFSQFPESRPFAAFDGDPRTAWLADRALVPERHWVEIGFVRPRDVQYVDILPRAEAGAVATAVDIAGKRYPVRRGWTHIVLGLHDVASLRVRVETSGHGSASTSGLAEVRVPGLHATESLRPPLLAVHALRGVDLEHANLEYSFSRASGDDPFEHTQSAGEQVHRRVTDPNRLEQLRVDGAGDEETTIDRVIDPPVARSYVARAWVSALPEASDGALDRLAGLRDGVAATSSARFEGRPGFRASSALDGDARTAWVAPWDPSANPWLRIRLRRSVTIRGLRIAPARIRGVAAPAAIRVRWESGSAGPLPVIAGRVAMPAAIRARALTVVIARIRGSRPPRGSAPAVGIAGLRISGVAPMRIRRRGPLASGCGAAAVATNAGVLRLRAVGGIAALDAGRPIRAVGCAPIRLPAGPQRLRASHVPLRIDALLLRSPAPAPIARAAAQAGRVSNPGKPGRGSRSDVHLDVRAPAWLVLGESYDRGWRARCDGHSLGAPVPLDGYANAWRVEPGCTRASFTFAPQRPVRILQILSALACLLLLVIALRGRRRDRAQPAPDVAPTAGAARMPVRRALVAGIAAGAVLGFCFSIRAGIVIAPSVAFVLWRGVPAAPLALAGGLLLAVVVPVVYLAFPAKDMGGYNPAYAGDHVGGNWIAVAAWVLLALALYRTLSKATRGAARAGRSGP